MKKLLRIGIIGCGSIGTEIAKAIENGTISATLEAVAETDRAKAEAISEVGGGGVNILNVPELVSAVDFVVEAASPGAFPEIMKDVIKGKKPVLIMSVGGLLRFGDILETLVKENIKVYLPSGAIAGLDAILAGGIAGIESIEITTRKPPKGLKGAPYLEKNGINLEGLTEEKVIFSGNVYEAIEGFPANINVSAVLSLAGIGPEKTRVTIVADPATKTNTHEIKASGKFGKILTRTENIPSPSNPKTSYLASLSAISLLKKITSEGIKVGS